METRSDAEDAPPYRRVSHLREQLLPGEFTVGGWCIVSSPLVAEVMALAGYDWVVVDRQHGLIGYEAMVEMIRALSLYGIPAAVRVSWNDEGEIMRALDAGAEAVIVPMIDSPGDAARAAAATRYPPAGVRSWGPVRPALQDAEFSPARANERVMCIPMVETKSGIESCTEIAALSGVDALLVGPADLSLSTTGSLERGSSYENHIASALDACAAAGIPLGTTSEAPEEVQGLRERGFSFVALSSDIVLLRRAAAESQRTARGGSTK